MSTIHFDTPLLFANIATVCVGRSISSSAGREELDRLYAKLARISTANTTSFNAQYRENAIALTAEQIAEEKMASTRMPGNRLATALRDVCSLNYNTDSDALPTPEQNMEVAEAFIYLMARLCRLAADRIDPE